MVSRKCIGCGKIKQRTNLIKITKVFNSDEIVIQPSSKFFGRSAYLCYNKECLSNVLKKRRLQKTLKIRKEIPASLLQNLEKIIY